MDDITTIPGKEVRDYFSLIQEGKRASKVVRRLSQKETKEYLEEIVLASTEMRIAQESAARYEFYKARRKQY